MKKTPEHYWNYRIGTYLFDYSKLDNEAYKDKKKFPDERLFSIIEVHYEKGKPISHGGKDLLQNSSSLSDLILSHKYIKQAFSRPILDLDNWPNEFK